MIFLAMTASHRRSLLLSPIVRCKFAKFERTPRYMPTKQPVAGTHIGLADESLLFVSESWIRDRLAHARARAKQISRPPEARPLYKKAARAARLAACAAGEFTFFEFARGCLLFFNRYVARLWARGDICAFLIGDRILCLTRARDNSWVRIYV